jgi:hypothetical protein
MPLLRRVDLKLSRHIVGIEFAFEIPGPATPSRCPTERTKVSQSVSNMG